MEKWRPPILVPQESHKNADREREFPLTVMSIICGKRSRQLLETGLVKKGCFLAGFNYGMIGMLAGTRELESSGKDTARKS